MSQPQVPGNDPQGQGQQVAETSHHDQAPAPRGGVSGGQVVLLMLAAAVVALIVGYLVGTPSDTSSAAPPPVASSEPDPTEVKPDMDKEEKKAEADEEQVEEEPAKPGKYERQCRDDKFVADCREATPEELNACGFCEGGACSGGSSSVRLVCESLALIKRAQEVASSGKGTVNLCDCQTQQAPAPAAVPLASE